MASEKHLLRGMQKSLEGAWRSGSRMGVEESGGQGDEVQGKKLERMRRKKDRFWWCDRAQGARGDKTPCHQSCLIM